MAISKQGESSENWLSDAIKEEAGADEGAIYDTVKGDKLPKLKQKREERKKKSGLGLGTLFSIAMKVAPMMAGAPPIPTKEGGQIKSKVKKSKSKRVVRGVGAAKRGYGKATYSKKMY